MNKKNEYLDILNEIRYTLSPYQKFHEILNEYPEIRLIMKQSQVLHIIDRTSHQSLKILEALESIGLVSYMIRNQYFIKSYLTHAGDRFMMDFEEDFEENVDGSE